MGASARRARLDPRGIKGLHPIAPALCSRGIFGRKEDTTIHTTHLTVRYAETDRMGVTHHANYLVWYEQARTEFTRMLGTSYAQIEQMGLLSPLLEIETKYLLPCTYEDEIMVECRLVKASAAQMEFCYRVFKKGEEKPINTGRSRHAWVDKASFRPASLKKRAPELFAVLTAAVEPEA